MTAATYVPPNVLPPLLQRFAGLLEAKVVPRAGARAADDHAPTLLQQDRRLRRLPTLAGPEHRPTLDLRAGHRAQPQPGTKRWPACGTAEHARKSRIPSNRDGESAAAT